MKGITERVKKALENDNTIVVSLDKVQEVAGFTTEHMKYLGLRLSDLKKLERNGLALRGYVNNATKTKLGKTKSGHGVRWVLLGDSRDTEDKVQGLQEVQNEDKGTDIY